MNNKELAAIILEKVGGKDNVKSVMHCVTRLRFNVKNDSLVNVEELKAIKGVLGYVEVGGQHQVVIGPKVGDVYKEVVEVVGNLEGNGFVDVNENDKKPLGEQILNTISGIFVPIIPAIAGVGTLQALLTIITYFNLLDASTSTFQILSIASKASFYFLPLIIANSAAKKLNCNQYVAMAIVGVMLHPNFMSLVSGAQAEGTALTYFGLPVALMSYGSTVFPALLITLVQSVVEKAITKIMPRSLTIVFTPLLVILIVLPLALSLLGPVGTYLGSGLLAIVKAISSVAPWLVPMFVGLICPFVIMTGMHFASFIPMTVLMLSTVGYDNVIGIGMISSNFAIAGAVLGVAIQAKKAENKELGFATCLQAVFGITEPALYGLCVNYRTPMISSCLGGAIAGLIGGILGVTRYAQAGNSIISLTSYIGGTGLTNFYLACVCVAIALISAFIIQTVLKIKE